MEMTLSKIIVADDEAMQRNVLAKIIQNICPSSEVITCTNGKDVYDLLQEKTVDVVLTDIRMPIMNGMELIQKMSEEFPKTKVILISAHQEFEYAQNAIKYKVVDYLIKPFRVSEVQKVMEKVQDELQKESENEHQLNNYQTLVSEVRKQEKNLFLQAVLSGSIETSKLEQEEFRPLQDFGSLAVLRFKTATAKAEPSNGVLSDIQQGILMDHIHFLFPNTFVISQQNQYQVSIHKLILLLPRETAVEAAQKLEYCLTQLRDDKIIFWAGISNTKLCLADAAAEALSQAEEMLAFYFYENNGGVFSYDKMNTIMELPPTTTTTFEKQLQQAMRGSDLPQIEQVIEDMKRKLSEGARCYPNKIKHRVSSMIVLILKDMDHVLSQSQYDQLLNQSYQLFADCDHFEQLFEISSQLLGKAVEYSQKNSSQQYDVIDDCITYIKDHLDSELSLQKVADYIHFHPNYLSVKIKEKVGLSYSAFLLNLRMEYACQLLMDTNDKIQEIAVKCGFSDSNYFNRLFRREYHISPEQYRKARKNVKK